MINISSIAIFFVTTALINFVMFLLIYHETYYSSEFQIRSFVFRTVTVSLQRHQSPLRTMKMSVTTNEYNANTIDIFGWGFASLDRFLAVNAPEN